MENKEKTIEELAREERLQYFKEWRAKNKDKLKETNARYWKKRAETKLKLKGGENIE